MRFAKLEQQAATHRLVSGGAQSQGVERHLEELRGVLDGEQCLGALAGPGRVVYSPIEVAAGAEVVRQFRQKRASIAAAERLESAPHCSMHPASRAGAQFIVKRDPNQVMNELVAPIACPIDDMSGQRFVQRLDHLIGAKWSGRSHQQLERETAADYRGKRQNLIASRGEKVEATADHLLQPFGNPDDARQRRVWRFDFGVEDALLF